MPRLPSQASLQREAHRGSLMAVQAALVLLSSNDETEAPASSTPFHCICPSISLSLLICSLSSKKLSFLDDITKFSYNDPTRKSSVPSLLAMASSTLKVMRCSCCRVIGPHGVVMHRVIVFVLHVRPPK